MKETIKDSTSSSLEEIPRDCRTHHGDFLLGDPRLKVRELKLARRHKIKGEGTQLLMDNSSFLFGEPDRKDIKPERKCKTRNREKAIITGKIKGRTQNYVG